MLSFVTTEKFDEQKCENMSCMSVLRVDLCLRMNFYNYVKIVND